VKRFLIGFLLASTSVYGSAILVTSQAMFTSTDALLWSQLGSNLTNVSQTFFATSSGEDSFTGHLTGGTGEIVKACTTCSFAADAGINANDALLLTGLSTSNAPLALSTSPVYGLGTYIQAATSAGDTDAQFTARIQAYAGVNSVLTATVTSDKAGDAVFIGVMDSTADITYVILSLTNAAGTVIASNFVLDKLFIQNGPEPGGGGSGSGSGSSDSSVPEPALSSLVGSALLALVLGVRKRSVRA